MMYKKRIAASLAIFANFCMGSAQRVPQYGIQTVDWEPAVFKGVPYQPAEQSMHIYRTNSSPTRNNSVEVGDSWMVSEIFEKKKAPANAKAIGRYSNVVDAEYFLLPVSLNSGTYRIKIHKETSELYEIVGEDMFIELSGNGLLSVLGPCDILTPTVEVLLTKDGMSWKIYKIK